MKSGSLEQKRFACSRKLVVMHVCWLNPLNQSGYETRVVEETRLLGNQGVKVIIACFIASGNSYTRDQVIGLHRRLKDATGARIHILPTGRFFDLEASGEMRREITLPIIALTRLYNAALIHGQALYSAMHILRARPHLDAKVVFDVHGVSPEEAEMNGESRNRIESLERWEKEALKSADLRIFVSTRMKSFLERKYGLPESPSVLLPCCVHGEKFMMGAEPRREKRARMGLQDRFVILYLGTLSVWQWPEAMFALFSRLYRESEDSFFYMLLPHADHERAEGLFQEQRIPPGSFLIEEKTHEEVGSFIGVADAGLLLRKAHPVNYVSSPTKFGEYLAAGVPVIATRGIGDVTEIIEQRRAGLIVDMEGEGISASDEKRLRAFIKDVGLHRRKWSEKCRRISSELLDWEKMGGLLKQGYERTLQGSVK